MLQPNHSRFKRIVAMSDIHGDSIRMGELLRAGGVLNLDGSWQSKDTLIVFNGDYFDRGPSGIAVVNEIRRIQSEAPEGCEAVAIMGNHDAMILSAALYKRSGEAYPSSDNADIIRGNGAKIADIESAAADDEIIFWLQNLQAVHAEGGYLFQHVDGVLFYRMLGAEQKGSNSATMNAELNAKVQTALGAWTVFAHMTDDRRFFGANRDGLKKYLQFFTADRVVHGHTCTPQEKPEVWMGGLAINIDGNISVGYGKKPDRGCLWSVDLTNDDTETLKSCRISIRVTAGHSVIGGNASEKIITGR